MGTVLVLAVVGLTRLFFGLLLLPVRLAFAAAGRRAAQPDWHSDHGVSWPPPVPPGGWHDDWGYSQPAAPPYWPPPEPRTDGQYRTDAPPPYGEQPQERTA